MKTKVTTRTVVKSNRTPEILAALKRARGSYVTVGVHRGAGKYDGDNAPTVDKVAFWLEFGTENMRARPFMSPAVMRNKSAIAKITARSLVSIAYLQNTVSHGLSQIGIAVRTMIENVIKSNVGPPLTGTWDPPDGYLGWRREHFPESGQRTLVASGLLLRSVQFVLHLTDAAKAEKPPKASPMHADAHAKGAKKVKGPPKDGRDEFGRYLKRTPAQLAERKAAVKAAKAFKKTQKAQREKAAADPAGHAAAFNRQKRAFTRGDKPI